MIARFPLRLQAPPKFKPSWPKPTTYEEQQISWCVSARLLEVELEGSSLKTLVT